MTRRRWIADEVSGNRAALTGAHAEHLARVLRAQPGQEFDIATGTNIRRGRITSVNRDRVEFELGEEIPLSTDHNITIALAIFKFDRLEWAIEKCTELGVSRIVPIITQRTEAHLAASAPKRRERWQRIVTQASEQSRRASVPEIAEPLKLKDTVSLAAPTRILLSESEDQLSIKQTLASHTAGSEIILAVGPEGGWTDEEQALFKNSGWISASLGNTVLRAETAAIAALAIVKAELT